MSGPLGRVLALRRSLGRRGIAALTAAVLAAAVVAAVALAGGNSKSSHGRRGVQAAHQSGSTATTTTGSPTGAGRAAAGVAPHRKAPARRVRAASARPAHHGAPAKHTSRSGTSTSPTTTSSPGSTTASVLFALQGGGDASVVACGARHHYRTYAAGASVSFSGAVKPVPSGQWKVKLHIKACQGGEYRDFTKIDTHRNNGTGTFHGTFSAPQAGLYEVRAVLYLAGSESTKSDKVHLESN